MRINFKQLTCGLLLVLLAARPGADIVLDGSAGPAGELVGPEFSITEDLGTVHGSSLLHSFFSFNIASEETANFSSNPLISNIIARVTGPGGTTINGILNADSNLWLLNPNGVMVGSDASINVAGSFRFNLNNNIDDDVLALIMSDGSALTVDSDLNTLSIANPLDFGFLSDVSSPRIVVDDSLTGSVTTIIGVDNAGTTEFTLNGDDPDIARFAGDNLFYSFARFNLFSDDRAIFRSNRTMPVENIIVRVTGGSHSFLNGRISTSSALFDSSLWFINPAGIIAGDLLRLDVSGSIGLGAADTIQFDDGSHFFADTSQPVTLSVGNPGSYGFTDSDLDRGLSLNGTLISSFQGGDIVLAGLDLSVQFSLLATQDNFLGGPGGDIMLIGNNQQIINSQIFTLSSGDSAGDISFVGEVLDDGSWLAANSVNVSGPFSQVTSTTFSNASAGDIIVSANNLSLADGAFVANSTLGFGNAGNILFVGSIGAAGNIQQMQSISLDNASIGGTSTGGFGGQVVLFADDIRLGNLSNITTSTVGFPGTTGGGIFIFGNNVLLDSGSNVASIAAGDASGGDIIVSAGSLTLQGSQNDPTIGVQLHSHIATDSLLGSGNAGLISIDVDQLNLFDSTFLSSGTQSNGDAGDIIINATDVLFRGSSTGIFISRFAAFDAPGIGRPGDVTINAQNSVVIENTGPDPTVSSPGITIFSTNCSLDCSVRGTLTINTPSFNASGATLAVSTLGSAPGGNIILNADSIVASNTLFSGASLDSGQGGSIQITADQLHLTNGSSITTSSAFDELQGVASVGDAGDIQIDVAGELHLFTSSEITGLDNLTSISSRSNSPNTDAGSAGTIQINAGSVLLENAQILATAEGGNDGSAGGDISLNVTGDVGIFNGGRIQADTNGGAPGGRINMLLGGALTLNGSGSALSSNATGLGDGGTVAIDANSVNLENGARIETTASAGGNSGSVRLDVSGDLVITSSDEEVTAILTLSNRSQGGDINVRVGDTLTMTNSGIISSVDQAAGNGGDVNVTTNSLFLQKSVILAQAEQGNGGAITINRLGVDGQFIIDTQSIVNADSARGVSGEINVESPDTDETSVIQPQDARIENESVLVDNLCSRTQLEHRSTLVVQDQGGVAPAPDGYHISSISEQRGHISGTVPTGLSNTDPQSRLRNRHGEVAGCR